MIGGHVIVCDDIRQEVGGKHALIGIYRSMLRLHAELPATLPKLGLVIIWSQSLEEERLKVDFSVYLPGSEDAAVSGSLDPSAMNIVPTAVPDEERVLTMEAVIVISPCEIREEGELRVIAQRGGKRHFLRRLEVTAQAPESTEGHE